MMKTFLLLAMSSVVTAATVPSLSAKIILSALVLMAALTQTAGRAPVGYQDKKGFHRLQPRVEEPANAAKSTPPSPPWGRR